MTAQPSNTIPGFDGVATSTVHVTPELAKAWLELNHINRKLKRVKIEQFANDMQRGAWLMTGEAIKFADDGSLIDGQNRLSAIVKAGVAVDMLVVRGLKRESQIVMDSGTMRSRADALHFLGYSNGKDIAPAATCLKAWRSGFYVNCMVSHSPSYTKTEIAEYVDGHPKIPQIAVYMKKVQRSLPLPVGPLTAAGHEFMEIDPDAMADFFERIVDLRTSGKTDPVSTLIRRVSDERARGRRITPSLSLYLLARSWNAYRSEEPLSKFQIGSAEKGWAAIPSPI